MKQAELSDANMRSVEDDANKSSDRQIRVEEPKSRRKEGVSSGPEENVTSVGTAACMEGDYFCLNKNL